MTYTTMRKKTAELMDANPAKEEMPCPQCGKPTKRATLIAYGARCWRCYEAYCRAPLPARRMEPA